MRVLYFSRDYSTHDHRFLTANIAAGNQVHYARLENGPRQVEDRPVPEGVEIVQWAGGNGRYRRRDLPRLARSFRSILERLRPDVVHAGPIQDVALIAALAGARPLLVMSWGFDLMQDVDLHVWNRLATRYALRRAAAFVSDAEGTRERAVALGMPADRTFVFPWGVDLDQFAPRPGRRPTDEFVVLCNRSWEPRYGVDVLARAFVRAARERDDLRLFLLGDGSQGAAIRAILTQGGMLERTLFTGHVRHADLPAHLNRCDLFVTPSHVDGSSVSLLEALACGLPVLVSDIPTNLEWVTHGQNGRVFPDGDVEALAGELIRAAADRQALAALGQAARRTAEERADWNKNFAVLLQAYQLAIERERR